MNRTIRAIIGIVFIGVIMFSAVSISQNLGRRLRIDITDRRLYVLSNGTKAVLSRLWQPITMKLYYAKTAAMKAPDPILFFNNYYLYVESLLQEYAAASNGMVKLEVIDPRPFSEEEADALRCGLKRLPLSEEENFFFGLVVQTPFGVVRSIPFFSPERQSFVEYDVSYLIDTAISRQKKRIGVLSSLPVMGEQMSSYMAQMMAMQGQRPPGPWTIINQLWTKYEVSEVKTEVEDINNVDILLVIHPKNLPEKALFAVDQFVLKGGRAIVCVDPYCYYDRQPLQMGLIPDPNKSASNLERLMRNWGLEMPFRNFAGDRKLAVLAGFSSAQRPQRLIAYLGLTPECFNQESVVTANLNDVRVLFPGVLKEIDVEDGNDVKLERIPLVSTTGGGNLWTVEDPYELTEPDPAVLMSHFTDGNKPVRLGYLVTGRFKSAFPDGITVTDESDPNSEPRRLKGLAKANSDCVVAVFSDVDFITDMIAYQDTFMGRAVVGDNAALMLNMIDDLGGSSDLISIRSRGNFRRPFVVVDRIESEAERGTAEQEAKVNAEINGFKGELAKILSSAKEGEEEIVGSSILQKRKDLELKLHQAQMKLRDIKMKKRERIERLGDVLRNLNTLPGPVAVLLIAVCLGLWRNVKRRRYISHASDA